MPRVVALVPDLLFGSKLVAALTAAGYEVDLVQAGDEARSRVVEAALLIVDLSSADYDGATLVESMLMGRELAGIPTLGFFAHVDPDTRTRALDAGFDLVVPRSRMAREPAQLVAGLLSR